MQYIKLQLGCLVVILYINVNYVKATIKKIFLAIAFMILSWSSRRGRYFLTG